jgi:hypothetical protein
MASRAEHPRISHWRLLIAHPASAPARTDRRIIDEIARFLCGVACALHGKISLNCGARWLNPTVMTCVNGSSCAKEK